MSLVAGAARTVDCLYCGRLACPAEPGEGTFLLGLSRLLDPAGSYLRSGRLHDPGQRGRLPSHASRKDPQRSDPAVRGDEARLGVERVADTESRGSNPTRGHPGLLASRIDGPGAGHEPCSNLDRIRRLSDVRTVLHACCIEATARRRRREATPPGLACSSNRPPSCPVGRRRLRRSCAEKFFYFLHFLVLRISVDPPTVRRRCVAKVLCVRTLWSERVVGNQICPNTSPRML